MIEKLKEFLETRKKIKPFLTELDGFFVEDVLPFDDFNREIIPPGSVDVYPDGALGIRVDEDFWAVAALPYEFRVISIEDLVATLWPHIKNPTFNKDSYHEPKN